MLTMLKLTLKILKMIPSYRILEIRNGNVCNSVCLKLVTVGEDCAGHRTERDDRAEEDTASQVLPADEE